VVIDFLESVEDSSILILRGCIRSFVQLALCLQARDYEVERVDSEVGDGGPC
jgi:hypothetical protein